MGTVGYILIIAILLSVIVYTASAAYLDKRKDLADKYKDNLLVKMRIGLSRIFSALSDFTFHEDPPARQ